MSTHQTTKPTGGLDSNTVGELEALGSNDTTSPGDGVRALQDQPRPAGGACGEAGFDSPTGMPTEITPPGCPECGRTGSLTGFCHGRFIGPVRRRYIPQPEYLADGEWMI